MKSLTSVLLIDPEVQKGIEKWLIHLKEKDNNMIASLNYSGINTANGVNIGEAYILGGSKAENYNYDGGNFYSFLQHQIFVTDEVLEKSREKELKYKIKEANKGTLVKVIIAVQIKESNPRASQ